MRKTREPTPLLKSQKADQPKARPSNSLNWQRFTVEAAQGATQYRGRVQLVNQAFRSSPWKRDGRVIFLGVTGWIEELREAGEIVSRAIGGNVDAYDTFRDVPDSIFESTKLGTVPHIRTPPTVHGAVRLGMGYPDFAGEIIRRLNFVCFANGVTEPLEKLRPDLFEDAVLIGCHDTLKAFARTVKLRYFPLGWFGKWFAVRVEK